MKRLLWIGLFTFAMTVSGCNCDVDGKEKDNEIIHNDTFEGP